MKWAPCIKIVSIVIIIVSSKIQDLVVAQSVINSPNPPYPRVAVPLVQIKSSTNWSVCWRMIPYSRPKRSDLYTLSQRKLLQNHTLQSGTYLYIPYVAVPPSPPGAKYIQWTSIHTVEITHHLAFANNTLKTMENCKTVNPPNGRCHFRDGGSWVVQTMLLWSLGTLWLSHM